MLFGVHHNNFFNPYIEMAPSTTSNLDFENILINAVSLRPLIYDKADPSHSKRKMTNKAWVDISREIGKDVNACKSRWRTLKDRFNILHQKYKHNENAAIEDTTANSWKYYKMLNFLTNVNELGINTRNELKEESIENAYNDENPETDPQIVISVNESSTSSLLSSSNSNLCLPNQNTSHLINPCNPDIAKHIVEDHSFYQQQQPQKQQNAVQTANSAFTQLIQRQLETFPEHIQDDLQIEILQLIRQKKRKLHSNSY